MRNIDLSRYAPAGFDWKRELKWCCAGGAASLLYSLTFFNRFSSALRQLYDRNWRGEGKKLLEGAVMADFREVLGSSLTLFFALALCMLLVCVVHYAYHYRGSKSAYLMRRLPDRWDWHRRCLGIPVAAALLSLLAAFLLLLVYYWVYMTFTPGGCLASGQWQKIWRSMR